MAIQRCLYLYVAEVILQDHVGVESTIFGQDHIDLFPPQDSRLYLLLNMAGSPSMRSMAFPASPFLDSLSLFSRILRGIGDFLGVSSYDNNPPVVVLDTNRHAVLKLLHTLISSAEFDDLIVTGLASEQLDVQVRQQSLEYLYEPDNLFTSCKTLITWDDVRTLRRLALLHPRDPTWSRCLRQLEDFDFPEWALGMHDIPHTVSDFKAFIEAGCVGAFGKVDTASSNFMRLDQEDEDSPRHPWSTAWRRVRRFIPGEPSREEIELSSNDNGV
ncbi:hypothetical protein EDD85DRAFT_1030129 [Armillaria nabsnona]|nr:hypothetical protein EDD85DRAFT_1030129 [Armillaria nabsnona]